MKSLSKKTYLCIFFGLFIQAVFLPVSQVYAFYNDTESSGINISATSLDFELVGEGFSSSDDVKSLNTKEVEIKKVGELAFNYIIVPKFGARTLLCGDLTLTAKLNGQKIYEGNLSNFFTLATSTLGVWELSLVSRNSAFGYCDVDFVYKGWQTDFSGYAMGGFSDIEEISNSIFVEEPIPEPEPESCMKINEVYYYPGTRNSESNPEDEWIELYNSCEEEINIKKWYLENANGKELINQNYIIGGHQFVVVVANASTWSYWPDIPDNAFKIALGGQKIFGEDGLSEKGDVVHLYDSEKNLIDSVSWGDNYSAFDIPVSVVAEGHSISRKQKGVDTDSADDWMDTYDDSVPAGPNPGTNPHSDDEDYNQSEEETKKQDKSLAVPASSLVLNNSNEKSMDDEKFDAISNSTEQSQENIEETREEVGLSVAEENIDEELGFFQTILEESPPFSSIVSEQENLELSQEEETSPAVIILEDEEQFEDQEDQEDQKNFNLDGYEKTNPEEKMLKDEDDEDKIMI